MAKKKKLLKKMTKIEKRILKDAFWEQKNTRHPCILDSAIKAVFKRYYPECFTKDDRFHYGEMKPQKYKDLYVQFLVDELDYHRELSSEILETLKDLYKDDND